MGNKKNADKTTQRNKNQSDQSVNSSGQPATPQMEKEQPIVNEQEQVYPVNPQDGMFKQDSPDDVTSEHEMNKRTQQDETDRISQNQSNDYDTEDVDADMEDPDNGMKKIPKNESMKIPMFNNNPAGKIS